MAPEPELLKRSQYFTPPTTEHAHSSRTHFFDWQEYHRPLARMHHAHLHDWGVANGLAVSVTEDGTSIEVQSGVAIDSNGELIALALSGQADISLTQPGEASQQISAPFRLTTNGLTNERRYLTVQFAERLRFGEGSGGKLEQTPWLRLQPTAGDGAYVDDGSAIILALVAIDAAGVITVKTTEAGLAHGRRLLATTAGALHVRRPGVAGDRVEEQLAARLEPGDGGGLRVSVPAAGDSILFQRQDGGRFAKLAVHADQADLLGDLLVQGQLRVNGVAAFTRSVGIGTDIPNRSLSIEGVTESYLNLRTQAGAEELLMGVDANGGIVSTLSNHDLHLRAAGNNPQVILKVNGNVGIGTLRPNKLLSVAGEIETDYAGIHFGGIRDDYHYGIGVRVADSLVYETSDYHRWRRQNAELMTLTPDGRLGIGTTNPIHLLSVLGGPTWTSNRWGGAVELANAAAIAWRANSANQRCGFGHTDSGFYIFRTASDPGTTGSPAIYDFVIDNRGNVGIGTTSPTLGLDVRGHLQGWIGSGDSSQSVGGWRLGRWPDYSANTWVYLSRADSTAYQDLAVGTLWAGGSLRFGSADDLAEMTPVRAEDNLEPGDVVIIDEPDDDRVLLAKSRRPYDRKVAGVISDPTQAGLIIGGSHPTDIERNEVKPIALAGRVLTKVTTENGSIKAGDVLTTAATAGYAMKATAPGWILGKALQSFDAGQSGSTNGKIWVHVNLGWCGASDESD